ncbi:MAG: CHAD domain-containing protein [Pseudomonadota bacterium]
MQQLLILRHAIALDRDEAARQGLSDAERPLTPKGERRMAQVATSLQSQLERPALILNSPLLRARQTAELLARRYPGVRRQTCKALSPGTPPTELIDALAKYEYHGPLVLTGHEPDLSTLIALLVFGEECANIQLKKAGAALLTFTKPIDRGRATLEWLLLPTADKTVSVSMDAKTPALNQTGIEPGLERLLREKRQAIDRESERFVQIGDAEALHDLRVAMRRLHSLFVAFAPAMDSKAAFPTELKRLLKETNHARDLEVTLALLRGQQLGLDWLETRWQQELEQEYQRLRDTLPPAWYALAPALEQPATLIRPHLPGQQLGPLAAQLLKRHGKQLNKRRKKLCAEWADKPAHKTRIVGKQVRYLLEPFAAECNRCSKAVKRLKGFQDWLGDYHDVVVLRAKLKTLLPETDARQRQQLKQARKQLDRQRRALKKRYLKRYCNKQLQRGLRKARKALVS